MTREDELKAIQALTDANVALEKENQALRDEIRRLRDTDRRTRSRRRHEETETPIFGPGAEISSYYSDAEDPADWVFGPA